MDTSHIFWAIEIQFFMSSHDLHYIFPPHPLVQKTLSMYIANKIARDQNVCTTTQCTNNNNFNHDTRPHVYERFYRYTLYSSLNTESRCRLSISGVKLMNQTRSHNANYRSHDQSTVMIIIIFYWPIFPRSRSTAAWTFPAVAAKARMFSCVSKKPISWSWANCVAYSSSGGTANFDITLLMRRL